MRITLPSDHVAPPVARRPRHARGFALLWVAAVLLPALGVGGTALMSWRDVRDDARVRLDRNTEMLRQHALRAFATQEAILAALSRAIAGLSWEEIRRDATLHGLLTELVAAGQPLVRAVVVADEAGRVAAASYEYPARATDLSDRGYMRDLHAGAAQTVGEVLEARPMGWRAFGVARRAPPRPGAQGEPGTLVASFSPEPLVAFYASVVETTADVVALTRLDGAFLARHPPLPAGQGGPDSEAAARLQTALASAGGAGLAPSIIGADGMRRHYVARQVGEWPVAVLYGMNEAALLAEWRQRMMAPLASGLGAAVLLLALTAFAARGAKQERRAAERRMEAEAKLAGASRAAAIGLLAAGLAHDVKNLVQAVHSGTRLMDQRADDPAEVRRCARLLADAAARGGKLVAGMLAFARGGDASPDGPLDALGALRELAELLNRTLGSGWRVKAALPAALPATRGDRPGFEAAVVNLAANARDAMPGGGVVSIATWAETVTEAQEAGRPRPGRYLVVAVSDSGAGIPPDVLARLGEPFFTTKPAGEGTGLGLATVRGFCERAGGVLRISSEPGKGTTAQMWLPVLD